jgi:uncharacterized protein YdaU (DUF1376 family)
VDDEIKLPYLDFYYNDFMAGTSHFTHQQRGIYISLICASGNANGKGLPNIWNDLCRIVNIYDSNPEKMEELKIDLQLVISQKFQEMDGKLHNIRQKTDFDRKAELIKLKKYAGSKGGLAKSKQKPSRVSESESESIFTNIWNNLKYKKGSRIVALNSWRKNASQIKPETLIEKFNEYCRSVDDPKFIAHFSTWLNQNRWEEELPTKKEETFNIRPERTYKDYVFAVKSGMRMQYISQDMVEQMRKENLITEEEYKRW